MIEVSPNLWVGGGEDLKSFPRRIDERSEVPQWFILTCAKEPWHREALGYTAQGAPKDHPEYLFARRQNRLILNMVDAENPDYFPEAMIDEGLRFIGEALKSGAKVLVHCNQGESRGPGMAFLYLLSNSEAAKECGIMPGAIPGIEYLCEMFRRRYPAFNPKAGILGMIVNRLMLTGEMGTYRKITIDKSTNVPAHNAIDDPGDGWLMRMK